MKHEDENVRPVGGNPSTEIVSHIIQCHDGNASAAIESLLEDIRSLREQLALASVAISTGYTRGWRPSELDDAS
nr:dehydrogenase [Agrobacterium vitis]